MNAILIVALIVFMALTVAALVRGIVILLKTKEAELMGTGPSASGIQQNRAMRSRIMFQALAVLMVVLLLLLRK